MKGNTKKHYYEASFSTTPAFNVIHNLEQQIGKLISPNGLDYTLNIDGKIITTGFGKSAELSEFSLKITSPLKDLATAIKAEDYENAARLRDNVKDAKTRYYKIIPSTLLDEYCNRVFEFISNEENVFTFSKFKRKV